MKNNFFANIRDIFLFLSLIMLIQSIKERNVAFLQEHKESIIHELDRDIIDQIYTAQRQLHFLQEHPIHADTFQATLAEIKNDLATIEEKYKKNSPGLALLGPIGSAAIVTKEEKLYAKLLATVNDLSNVFATICTPNEQFTPAQTVQNGLEANKQYLLTCADKIS